MVFTKSLLIKALGGVVGVAGTGVGVLAGTGVFDGKDPETSATDGVNGGAAKPKEGVTSNQVTTGDGATDRNAADTNQQDAVTGAGTENLPPDTVSTTSVKDVSLSNQREGENGEASGNKEGASGKEVSKPQLSNDQPTNSPNPQSPDETSTTTSPSANPGAGESQKQSTTDGADLGVGNLPSNPDSQQEVSEVQNRSTDAPGEGAGDHGRVSQEKQKGEDGKDSGETVDTKEKVSERQGTPQPGTGSQDGQVSDPNNAQNGVQISGDPSSSQITTGEGQATEGQQVNKDNGSDGSSTNPAQSPQQPVSGEQNPPNTLPSTEGEGENKEQQESIQGGSGGQGSQQSGAENPTNPDSGADSRGAQTSDISQPSNSAPEAGQPGGDNTGSTPPDTSGTPGADGAPGSTPSNEPGTGGDGTTGGSSGSSDISTTDQATQSQTKEAKINAKLGTLNIPDDCKNFETGNTSKTCSISEKELKKIKFEDSNNDDSSDDEASSSETKNIQLKIEILTGNKKTDYGFNDSEDENNLLFTLSGIQNQIEVVHGDLTIEANTNPEFKIEDGALKWIWSTFSDLTKKVGIKSNNGSYSFEENTKTLKYSSDSGTTINTLNSPTTSGTIYVEEKKDNYNQGVKVTFSANVTSSSSEGSDSLEKGDYEIKYKDGDNGGWYLSKATKPAGGDQA